jgi:hypothetical protein
MSEISRRKRAGHAWETSHDIRPESGDVIPVANAGSLETEYADPVFGSGTIRTVVLPTGGSVLAVALEGDAQPKILLALDPTDNGIPYIIFSDGTLDPWNNGGFVGMAAPMAGSAGVSISGGEIILDSGNVFLSAGVPQADPGVPGQLWVDPVTRVLKMSP